MESTGVPSSFYYHLSTFVSPLETDRLFRIVMQERTVKIEHLHLSM
jgi:hypothetical protein